MLVVVLLVVELHMIHLVIMVVRNIEVLVENKKMHYRLVGIVKFLHMVGLNNKVVNLYKLVIRVIMNYLPAGHEHGGGGEQPKI